jgi:bifunctional non-homologous end joining protein LigD
LEQVEKTSTNIYNSNRQKKELPLIEEDTEAKKIPKKTAAKKTGPDLPEEISALIKKGKKSVQPVAVQPMLASLTDKPFDATGWIYEIKWDGYRALAYLNSNSTDLLSRNNKSFNEKFYPLHAALAETGINAVFDGEVIVADENGTANFGNLQNWRSEADGSLIYYVFDILWYEGYDLCNLPLSERRNILKAVLPEHDSLMLSNDFETSGTEFFSAAEQMGLEGIMAKRAESLYVPGARTTDWLKIKTSLRHEVVIGGYTKNEGTAKSFSSLLVGVFDKGKLVYTGKIGTGFNDKTQKEMMKLFEPLVIKSSAFDIEPDINKPSRFRPNPPKAAAVWLKPELVCEVSYREMTSDGVMRHPSFEGMRADKPAASVGAEKELQTEKVLREKKVKDKQAIIKPPKATDRKTLLNPTDETQVRKINGREIKFGNLHKIFWPKEGYTKRDLLNYYYRMAPYILPHLVNRPQSMNRFPNGIEGKSFYQKDVTGKVPEWVETFPYVSEGINKKFMLCNDEAALLYMGSLGCIELNPWSSTIDKPDNPDWCVIDLDPDKNHFDQVIETALVTKEILNAAGAATYCKTSGSTGIHIYMPLGRKYDYEESKEFARLIATLVHQRLPKFTSIERLTANRKGKLYIDFLQNRPQATLAATYSLRPKPGATVSMPLHWDEIKKGMKMSDFNITNAFDRVKETGDIFKPVLGKGIDMKKVLEKLQQFVEK